MKSASLEQSRFHNVGLAEAVERIRRYKDGVVRRPIAEDRLLRPLPGLDLASGDGGSPEHGSPGGCH